MSHAMFGIEEANYLNTQNSSAAHAIGRIIVLGYPESLKIGTGICAVLTGEAFGLEKSINQLVSANFRTSRRRFATKQPWLAMIVSDEIKSCRIDT